MALYPYTLQPVDLNLTENEFRQAQQQIFDSNNQQLTKISPKAWAIVGVVVAIAIFRDYFYSQLFYDYFLANARWRGGVFARSHAWAKWYVKKEFEKQMASQTMPDEVKKMKIGIQQHGLVMSLPAPNAPKPPKGFNQPFIRSAGQQQAIIKWDSVTNWQETPDYIIMMFEVQGQQGTQIVPKRLEKQKFPIETLRHHLQETVGVQGFNLNNKATDQYFPDPNVK